MVVANKPTVTIYISEGETPDDVDLRVDFDPVLNPSSGDPNPFTHELAIQMVEYAGATIGQFVGEPVVHTEPQNAD